MPDELDMGLALLRITAGLLMAAHGAQKLLGWWGGSSMTKWTADLERQGVRPAAFWAWVSVGGQIAGLALAAGFLTPLSAAASLIAPMVVVVVQKWSKGFFNVRGGIEFMLLILAIGVALVLTGPGRLSVDALIGFELDLPVRLAVVIAAVAGGLLAVVPARGADRGT